MDDTQRLNWIADMLGAAMDEVADVPAEIKAAGERFSDAYKAACEAKRPPRDALREAVDVASTVIVA